MTEPKIHELLLYTYFKWEKGIVKQIFAYFLAAIAAYEVTVSLTHSLSHSVTLDAKKTSEAFCALFDPRQCVI